MLCLDAVAVWYSCHHRWWKKCLPDQQDKAEHDPALDTAKTTKFYHFTCLDFVKPKKAQMAGPPDNGQQVRPNTCLARFASSRPPMPLPLPLPLPAGLDRCADRTAVLLCAPRHALQGGSAEDDKADKTAAARTAAAAAAAAPPAAAAAAAASKSAKGEYWAACGRL